MDYFSTINYVESLRIARIWTRRDYYYLGSNLGMAMIIIHNISSEKLINILMAPCH